QVYLKRGDFLELRCKPGYELATNLSQSTFTVQCNGNPIVYPECKEIRCDPPTVANGTYHPKKSLFRELEAIRVDCNQGFHFETDNKDRRAECTKNGWLPIPRCILRPCDYPNIENGALTEYYENYKERAFPAQLGMGIYYRCLDGYVSEREEKWTLISCTKVGWSPAPKCLKKCSPGHLENGRFLSSYWTTYKEGDDISYVCSPSHNLEAKVTCTKNGWSPTPTCTSTKICEKVEIQNGYFSESKHRFNLNEEATYGCQIGYTTPEGNELGKTQCLLRTESREEQNSTSAITSAGFTLSTTRMTLLSCIVIQLLWALCANGQEITCDPPAVTNGTFQPQKRVFREDDVIRVDCNRGFHFDTDNREKTAECTKNGWLPIPRCSLKLCDYPHIENGRLTGYYKNHREKDFPVRLGVTIFYRCLDGYVSKSESTWNLIRCTADGWDPMPKCLKKCSPIWLANGRFLILWQKVYKEGDDISYVCDHEYIPENQQAKATCTKNNWMPTPRCIFNRFQGKMGQTLLPREPEDVFSPIPGSLTRIDDPSLLPGAGPSGTPHTGSLSLSEICGRTEVPHGYFFETKNRFGLNEKATYRCQIGYMTPEGNETGEIQCLEEGWSPFPECIKTCRMPAFQHIHFYTSKMVFLPEDILEYECADGYKTVNKISRGHTICSINGWTPEPQCFAIECEMLMLPHGEVFPKKDKYLNGDVVTFSCAKRYTRVGPDSAQCYYFGWSPEPPTCKVEIKACGPPPSITEWEYYQ
ncbi:complement factor H-like, partial [Mauremys reevesii]|uniref:complement factor H-like n=1 Tax=Mauremys reevesii TaxID=260615 RepID=UPI00193F941E